MKGRTARWTLLGVLSAALVGGVVASTSPWVDTRYAPGFDDAVFGRISIGDGEASVRAALGDPLMESGGNDHDGRATRYLHYSVTERSPTHMVRRCIVVDVETATVKRVDAGVHWSYGSRLFSQ